RAAGAFQRLDLADEDVVHQLPGGVGGVVPFGRESPGGLSLFPRRLVAGIVDPFLELPAPEPPVAGQVGGRVALPHIRTSSELVAGAAPRLPGPAIPPAATIRVSRS